jgi:tripartite-type tricarboxylate transporter receptor subunit TctC
MTNGILELVWKGWDSLKAWVTAMDIMPVASIMRAPYVMQVNPSVPAKTTAQFIDYAKANPGKINMGSVGNGSGTHLSGELFKMMTGVAIVHVPYRTAPFADLITGQVQVYFGPIPSSIEFIRARADCAR